MSITATTGIVRVISGEVTLAIITPDRYWRFESQGGGSDGIATTISELKMTYDESSNLLSSFTLVNIGGTIIPGFPLVNVNDGVAETVLNTSNSGVLLANGNFDFYVDFGAGNGKDVSVYSIAPQGNIGVSLFNTPTGFNAYKSSNAVDWELVKSFSSISTGIGPWNPGTFRDFDLTA